MYSQSQDDAATYGLENNVYASLFFGYNTFAVISTGGFLAVARVCPLVCFKGNLRAKGC
jgi:hypothetical protein